MLCTCVASVCVCERCEDGMEGGLELVIHQSCRSPPQLALSLSFSLCLIAWAWGKVLIMFSFIQTINPEAQCTRVPPSGDVTHLARTVPLSSLSLWVTGAPFFPSFFLNPRCTWTFTNTQKHTQCIYSVLTHVFLNILRLFLLTFPFLQLIYLG